MSYHESKLNGQHSPHGSTISERHEDPSINHSRFRRSSFQLDAHILNNNTSSGNSVQHRRNSSFTRSSLKTELDYPNTRFRRNSRPKLQVRFRSEVDVVEPDSTDWPPEPSFPQDSFEPMPPYFPTLPRLLFLALTVCLLVPSLSSSPLFQAGVSPIGAKAGPVAVESRKSPSLPQIHRRADSPTEVCKRWAHQSAVVNGTLYIYGGRATTSSEQTSNTWNNNLLSLDLTQSWQITTPSLTGLPQPSGPPAVALGYLWNSYDDLYLYGGQFSDTPAASPAPFSTWSYSIDSASWSEFSDPSTSAGQNSAPANEPVQRAAEGAGISVPQIGRGYYFGGHLDGYTTQGWSQSIVRVYLTSLLEYTFPGYTNAALTNEATAGSNGVYRNITSGGTQDSAQFPERADGALVYIPGYSKSGIIIGLAGGNNATFTQMNVIDVYDIETSTWYKQSTSGPTPGIRVNPCAVAVSAADGSSTQVHMYGGQNLVPYGEQKQYDDMWILSVPAFTWIQVNTTDQSNPPGRAGHTCSVWNAQMVIVGGYVGADISCDSGFYVFNTSSLSWQNEYRAFSGGDVLNRQASQKNDQAALQGSYGYMVPQQVQAVIGGNALGSATATAPAQSAALGPMATGKPILYPVPSAGSNNGNNNTTTAPDTNGRSGGSNTGAIVAGVIAGLLAILAAYLGFCAWLYRKQLKAYKTHVAMAQRQQLSSESAYVGVGGPALAGAKYSDKSKSDSQRDSMDRRSGHGSNPSGTRVNVLGSNNPYKQVPGGEGSATAASSTEDLMHGQEPSFLGVMLNPRRSLRVVNKD